MSIFVKYKVVRKKPFSKILLKRYISQTVFWKTFRNFLENKYSFFSNSSFNQLITQAQGWAINPDNLFADDFAADLERNFVASRKWEGVDVQLSGMTDPEQNVGIMVPGVSGKAREGFLKIAKFKQNSFKI